MLQELSTQGFSHEPSLFKVYDFILQTNILDIRMDAGHFCPLFNVKKNKKPSVVVEVFRYFTQESGLGLVL